VPSVQVRGNEIDFYGLLPNQKRNQKRKIKKKEKKLTLWCALLKDAANQELAASESV
jgi:hypothetical protein